MKKLMKKANNERATLEMFYCDCFTKCDALASANCSSDPNQASYEYIFNSSGYGISTAPSYATF